MQLQDQDIDEFIILYQKYFGAVLDREAAIDKGLSLCRLVELVDFVSEDED